MYNVNSSIIGFQDDQASKLRAFLIEGDTERELAFLDNSRIRAQFSIPKQLITKDSPFTVYTVDGEGNRSEPVELRSLEGMVRQGHSPQ